MYLISCGKKKDATATLAQKLYIGSTFKLIIEYVNRHEGEFFILSAQYHLLAPNDSVKSYEKSLNKMTKKERMIWTYHTYKKIVDRFQKNTSFTILAGKAYYEYLEKILKKNGYTISIPARGLSLGYFRHFLKS